MCLRNDRYLKWKNIEGKFWCENEFLLFNSFIGREIGKVGIIREFLYMLMVGVVKL